MNTPAALETVPQTCLVSDVCRLLAMSERQFYRLLPRLRELGILRDQLPKWDRRLRFQGGPIAAFLSQRGQSEQLRQLLRQVG